MRSCFRLGIKSRESEQEIVAIPSKWGLVSDPLVLRVIKRIIRVAIPSKWGLVSDISWRGRRYFFRSQSLLNEVLFPTDHKNRKDSYGSQEVAIPSKWGLVSDRKRRFRKRTINSNVAIPSKWGLVSDNRIYSRTRMGREVAIPSKWGLVSDRP